MNIIYTPLYSALWHACAEGLWKCERLNFFAILTFKEKNWNENEELTAEEFEPPAAQSEIVGLPAEQQGSWLLQLI